MRHANFVYIVLTDVYVASEYADDGFEFIVLHCLDCVVAAALLSTDRSICVGVMVSVNPRSNAMAAALPASNDVMLKAKEPGHHIIITPYNIILLC
jgi:hypothetical protein